MNESIPTLPPSPPRPFAPDRVRTPTGCGRVALVGCGFATLLLGVAAVVFLFKANDLLGWTLAKIESQLATRLPSTMTEEEKGRLAAAFTSARRAVESGDLDPRALQSLQAKLQRLTGVATTPVSREEMLALTESLEAVGRGATGTPAPGKTPAPAPTP